MLLRPRVLSALNRIALIASRRHNSQLSYYHHIGAEPLVHRTVGQQLERAAQLYGDREAIVSCAQQGRRLTFADVLQLADRLAAGYRKLGMQRGDRIGIWSPNTLEWYVTMMGAARAGLVSVALNPAYQPPEIAYCVQKVGMRAIFAAEEHKTQRYYELLREAVPGLAGARTDERTEGGTSLRTVVIDSQNSYPGAYTFQDLLHLATAAEVAAIATTQSAISADDPCNIQFTSGTTGQPKAATLSHNNFVNNGIHIANRSEMLATTPQRICVQVPLFHAFGVVIGIMSAMAHGSTLVLPAAGHSPAASLRAIEQERCTYIYGTPTMYVDLCAKQRELRCDLSSAQLATTGGSPCSPQLFRRIQSELQLRSVKTVFGLTETSASTYFSLAAETEDQVTETVGHLQDHLEAKVVDEAGRTVPMGEPGELLVRGYSTMLGYWGDAERTAETIGADRWLRTGDQFVMQPDGYGRIVGRLKDMIIRGGENIYPKEVEDFVNTMPQVLEAHVFGVPDERLGEAVAVAIRLRADAVGAGDGLSRAELVEYCRGQLAPYKVPRYVRVMDELPKTMSGKVQKFKLRDQFVAMPEEWLSDEEPLRQDGVRVG